MTTFLFAILCVALAVAAQFLLKAAMSDTAVKSFLVQPIDLGSVGALFWNPFIICGFALYGISGVVWLRVLSQWDVSKAYPLVGLGFVISVAIGWFIGEQVTFARLLGALMICVGVALVGNS